MKKIKKDKVANKKKTKKKPSEKLGVLVGISIEDSCFERPKDYFWKVKV